MSNKNKTFALLLTLIITMSCLTILTVKPANAQTGVTQPIVPSFRAVLQTYPTYIPPVYGVDPSTGKAVITKEGYTEEYVWINVDIGGQPFQKYNNSAGQTISLYYDVRWKGNHDSSWQSFNYSDGWQYHGDAYGDNAWGLQSTGVLIPIGFKGIDNGAVALQVLDPTATNIDLQVEALIGYYNSNNAFVGQSSGWSNTQTLEVSIPSDAAISSPVPSSISTSSPASTNTTGTTDLQLGNQPLTNLALIITVAVLGVAVVSLLVYVRRGKNRLSKQ